MHRLFPLLAVLAVAADAFTPGFAPAEPEAVKIEGNYYRKAVDAMKVIVPGQGISEIVTAIDPNTGSCSKGPHEFTHSPLADEVSFHFRGPVHLTQFAAYVPCSSPATQPTEAAPEPQAAPLARRHANHQHLHKRHADAHGHQKRSEWVHAVIDGQEQSWINDFTGPTAVPVPASAPDSQPSSEEDITVPSTASEGDWCRVANYVSKEGKAEGLTFLGHYGGSGSGGFTFAMGNSLSYLGKDGQCGSATSEVLDDVLIPSNKEFAIMTDKPCQGDECGCVRPDSVAYHGFGGTHKAFLMEMQMPLDGEKGFNGDMPAAWILNSLIPLTQQYGKCSCWPACGEFDVIEVLHSGGTQAKATFHGPLSGGSPDYFERPVDGPIKVAVVLRNEEIDIQILSPDFNFSETLQASELKEICAASSPTGRFSEFVVT